MAKVKKKDIKFATTIEVDCDGSGCDNTLSVMFQHGLALLAERMNKFRWTVLPNGDCLCHKCNVPEPERLVLFEHHDDDFEVVLIADEMVIRQVG